MKLVTSRQFRSWLPVQFILSGYLLCFPLAFKYHFIQQYLFICCQVFQKTISKCSGAIKGKWLTRQYGKFLINIKAFNLQNTTSISLWTLPLCPLIWVEFWLLFTEFQSSYLVCFRHVTFTKIIWSEKNDPLCKCIYWKVTKYISQIT